MTTLYVSEIICMKLLSVERNNDTELVTYFSVACGFFVFVSNCVGEER